jgi:chromosomal replication initiation ATPase DnaA
MTRDRNPREQLPLGFETRRSYERDAFVPGSTNEAALTFIDSWPDWPARVCAIWGPKGSGKTHLAHVWSARANASELRAADLSVDVVAQLESGGAYLIDDANAGEGGTALFHLLNFVNQTSGWLLLTGSEPPQRWRTAIPDLHSRLTAVPGIALDAPDETLLARALLKLFADRQLKLPEALIDYLVPRLQRSFAEAERIVEIIDTLALQQKRNISVEIGVQALRQLAGERGAASADNSEGLV